MFVRTARSKFAEATLGRFFTTSEKKDAKSSDGSCTSHSRKKNRDKYMLFYIGALGITLPVSAKSSQMVDNLRNCQTLCLLIFGH